MVDQETKSFSIGWIIWICLGLGIIGLILFSWPSNSEDPNQSKIRKPIPHITSRVFRVPAGATVDKTTKGEPLKVKLGDLITLERLQGPSGGLFFINTNLDPLEVQWPDRLRVKNTEREKDPIMFKNMNKPGTPDIVLIAKIGT
ncbi:MAG: hypothetical protein ABIF84_00745 [Patescibacteria group bacterium]